MRHLVPTLVRALNSSSSTRFFSNSDPNRSMEWFYKQCVAIPQAFQLQFANFDGAGTSFDWNCLAPNHAFERAFREVLGVGLTHEQITQPMGKKKRDHIIHIVQELKKTSPFLLSKEITEEDIDRIYLRFEQILNETVCDYSQPTPYLYPSLEFLSRLKIPVGLTTGYNRKTLEQVLLSQSLPFAVSSCADEVPKAAPGSTRHAMIKRNMEQLGFAKVERGVFVSDAGSDFEDLRGQSEYSWGIGVYGGSTHINSNLCKKGDSHVIAEQRSIAKRILLERGAHIVIPDLRSLPAAWFTLLRAAQRNQKPNQTEHLNIEQDFSFIEPREEAHTYSPGG